MGASDDYYDFHCGNDPRLVKIAIINDHFHTITIRANVAKTIDFSGGTRKVETIRLNKCFKTTRIIWPERTGSIKRLCIYQSDALTKLDVSALTSLEELSILNCRSLEEITGLSDSLKEINIHNVKLNALDISRLQKLQKINLITSADVVNMDISSLEELQIAAISTRKVMVDNTLHSKIDLSKCRSLHTTYIDTGDNLVDLKLSDCTGLQEALILCGKNSTISGLQDCKSLELFHAPQHMKMNDVSSNLARQFKAGEPTQKLGSLVEMTKEFYDTAKLTKAGIHDRETIIQETGSQIEIDKANAAKIMLLGTPLDIQMALNRKDLAKELRQVMIDNTYFPPAPLSPLYFLPQVAASELADQAIEFGIPHARRINKQNPTKGIVSWLENSEGFMPNLLLIEQSAMNTPSVLNFLKQFRTNPNVIMHANKQYPLRPYDKIILKGDWYRLKNRLPTISKVINEIPKAALAAPIGGGILASADARTAYQNMLMDANNLITQRMMESNRTLSHRSKNLQILKQAAEMKRLAREFFYYLEQMQPQAGTRKNLDIPPQRDIRYDSPDGQDNIDAASKGPKQAGEIAPHQPQAGTRKNLDIPPQRGIRYDSPDGQDNIDAASEGPKQAGEIPPLQPQAGTRKNLDIPPQRDIRYDTPDGQDNIDAASKGPKQAGEIAPHQPQAGTRKNLDIPPQRDIRYDTPDGQDRIDAASDVPPDMHGKKALQTPIDTPPDMHGKKALQTPIDTPPDMHGKKAPQVPIEPPPPDMHGKRALQEGIHHDVKLKTLTEDQGAQPQTASRKNDEWTPQRLVDYEPGPVMIDASASATTPPLLDEYVQLLLAADKAAKQILVSGDEQFLLEAAKKLADEVKELQDVGKFDASWDPQTLLAAARKLSELLENPRMQANPDNEQQLLIAQKTLQDILKKAPALFPDSNSQLLLDAAKKVTDSVKSMTENVEAPPEQTLIVASSQHYETPPATELKLLDAARNLAAAMQKLSATACAIDTSKSSPSAKAAAALIDTSVRELKRDVKNISLLDATSELIISMKLLAKACSDELPLTEKSEIEKDKSPELRTSVFKILQNAHRQYIKDHDLLNPGSNLFGRTPGKKEMRAEILARFIDALINTKSLNPEIVDKEFAKLMKDADLKYALGGIESEMKACLTGMKAPEPKPAPSNKLDDVD